MKPLLDPTDRRLLQRLLADIAEMRPAGALLWCKDGEPVAAPRPGDDPQGYARHVEEQHALQDYVVKMLAKLLTRKLTKVERARWSGGVHDFFKPLFRKLENRRSYIAQGPIKRSEIGKRALIIAEWKKLQAVPERKRASAVARELKVASQYVRRIIREEKRT